MSKMSAKQVMSSQCLCMNKVTFLLKLNYQVLLLNDTIIKLFKQKKNAYMTEGFFCKLKRNIEHWTHFSTWNLGRQVKQTSLHAYLCIYSK